MVNLANSNITKKALAQSLKTLMEKEDFSKISIADICSQCGMNRKSFYYHFKDKYDLMNWIFDVEILSTLMHSDSDDTWDKLQIICNYFYNHKKFYRKVLKIQGQNSFEEHFCSIMKPFIEESIKKKLDGETELDFYVAFYTDTCIISLKKWILENNSIDPQEFLRRIRECIRIMAIKDQEFKKS
ncbi:TetR/AcrR family transcriptional regulator C-terminal domain-containing protein [Blautia sp.]|jgi:probable dihydroxyacetone kinase regulator|uniref:TetR/AcrR family transcriptional regulator C-terminal domain-containing protein n=1 Tax=Blautia sp. TaxID=1955243 RepID=UPI003D9462E1